jgi:hypothetical protein
VCTLCFGVFLGGWCGELLRAIDQIGLRTLGHEHEWPAAAPWSRDRGDRFTHVHIDLVGVCQEDRRAAHPRRHTPQPRARSVVVHVFVVLPMLALVAAVPLAWGWGLTWLDVGLAVGFYFLSGFGINSRVSPPLHPPLLQGQPRAAQRPGGRRQPGPAG